MQMQSADFTFALSHVLYMAFGHLCSCISLKPKNAHNFNEIHQMLDKFFKLIYYIGIILFLIDISTFILQDFVIILNQL